MSAAGRAPALAVAARSRSLALSRRLNSAAAAPGTARAFVPHQAFLLAAAAGAARLFAFAHRRRPATGRVTVRGPLSSMTSARAALLCR